MATYTKPATAPTWNTGGANNSTPSGGKIILGWEFGEQPSSGHFNYLQKLYGEWLQWIDERVVDADSGNTIVFKNPTDTTNIFELQTSGYGLFNTGVEIGDSAFKLYLDTFGTPDPIIEFDSGDYLYYNRTSENFELYIASTSVFQVSATTFIIENTLQLGSGTGYKLLTSGTTSEILFDSADGILFEKVGNQMSFDIASTTIFQIDPSFVKALKDLQIFDSGYKLYTTSGGTVCRLDFDTGDYLSFARSPSTLSFFIGSSEELILDSSGLQVSSTINVGDTAFAIRLSGTEAIIDFDGSNDEIKYDRTANEFIFRIGGATIITCGASSNLFAQPVQIIDSSFLLDFISTNPILQFASGDYIQYDRTANSFDFVIGSSEIMSADATDFLILPNILVGDSTYRIRLNGSGSTADCFIEFDTNDYLQYDRDGGTDSKGTLTFFRGDTTVLTVTDAGGTDTMTIFGATNAALQFGGGLVAHGVTSFLGTDKFGIIDAFSSSNGGISLLGITEAHTGTRISGIGTSTDTSESTTSLAAIFIDASVKSGVSTTTMADDDNMVAIRNSTTTRAIFKGNGDLYLDGTTSAYDTEKDALACRDASYVFSNNLDKVLEYNREKLIEIGVMSEGGMVSTRRAQALMLGGIGEIYAVLDRVLEKLGLETYEQLRQEIRAEQWKGNPE